MVRQPLTVGTRVRVTIYLGQCPPAIRYGVIEEILETRGKCMSHPDDDVAYVVASADMTLAYCASQCEPV